MDWQTILNKARIIKENFERSYKCLNIDRPTKPETIEHHFQILLTNLEDVRILFNVNYNRLTVSHQRAAEAFFHDLRNRTVKLATKKLIQIDIPDSLHESIHSQLATVTNDTTMAQTMTEFLNTASKLITDFDGKAENLQSFIDALSLIDSIKGTHEATAVSLIKTRLRGSARNLISTENTIISIINKLKNAVKGESVEVLTAKIQNIKQNNKTANTYCAEIEALTKSLETAYISDGLPSELAGKYSTQTAVKAMTKNCTNSNVKLIMEAGQFNSMNDAISKFVNSCTEATGQQNAILYYQQRQNNRNNNFRGNYPRFPQRNNVPRNNFPRNNNYNNNNNRDNGNTNYRQRSNNNRRNKRYVRATESNEIIDSENQELPLRLIQ